MDKLSASSTRKESSWDRPQHPQGLLILPPTSRVFLKFAPLRCTSNMVSVLFQFPCPSTSILCPIHTQAQVQSSEFMRVQNSETERRRFGQRDTFNYKLSNPVGSLSIKGQSTCDQQPLDILVEPSCSYIFWLMDRLLVKLFYASCFSFVFSEPERGPRSNSKGAVSFL